MDKDVLNNYSVPLGLHLFQFFLNYTFHRLILKVCQLASAAVLNC